jgi:hypothetical protein
MANLIQIKRSTTADAPIAGSLVTGELAYSLLSTSNSLFVGDGSNNAIRVGGGKYLWLHQANVASPGALTANAVVVTNGNGYVTAWKTNNLIVGTDGTTVNIASISTAANSTQIGASAGGSNTELVTSYAIKTYVEGYVLDAKPIVTNQQVGFGNSSNFLTSSADFTFDNTTDRLHIGNTTVNAAITPTAITVGANAIINSTALFVGNSTVNTVISSATIDTDGTLAVLGSATLSNTLNVTGLTTLSTANVTSTLNVVGAATVNGAFTVNNTAAVGNTTVTGFLTTTGTVNATAVNVGANVNLTTSEIDVGNTTTNAVLTSTTIKVGSATVNTVITGSAITTTATVASGNTTVTGFVNASSYGTFGGTVNATALNIGANVNLTSGRINVGNSTVNTFITSTAIETDGTLTVLGAATLSNTLSVTGLMTMSSANLTSSLNVVGAATVNGAFLVNNTASVGNTTISGTANVTSSINVVGAATVNGALTVNNTAAVGNTTITGFANVSSTLNVVGAATVNGALTVNNTAALGNTTITGFANVSSTLQVSGNASFAQNASVTGHLSVGTFQTGDATISGNLTITGTLTTVSANNITVTDPMIQLASNNTTSDVLDIGFFGSYEAGDAGNHEHTGIFRDASDGGVYKLFENLEPSPTTTVDTANATFQIAMLQTFLKTGGAGASGLIANATTIALTANSTLNVAIVANTLSLSTALPGTSGGTGLNSFTAEDILVANSSNGFRALAKGTEGTVLQISSGVVAYTTLDGGTF